MALRETTRNSLFQQLKAMESIGPNRLWGALGQLPGRVPEGFRHFPRAVGDSIWAYFRYGVIYHYYFYPYYYLFTDLCTDYLIVIVI